MIEVELQIPAIVNSEHVIEVVEKVCISHNLICARKGTLASYPGCTHWHFKMGKQKGTLEITWWEAKNRLWLKVAKSRMGDWIAENITTLKKKIENSL